MISRAKHLATDTYQLLIIALAFPLATWILFGLTHLFQSSAAPEGAAFLCGMLLMVSAVFGGGLSLLLCLWIGISSGLRFARTKDVDSFRYVVAAIGLASVPVITFAVVSNSIFAGWPTS